MFDFLTLLWMLTNDFETTLCFIGKYNLSIHSLVLDESSQSYVYMTAVYLFVCFVVTQMVIQSFNTIDCWNWLNHTLNLKLLKRSKTFWIM